MIKNMIFAALIIAAANTGISPRSAVAATSVPVVNTLQRIKETGEIRIGYGVDPPFGYRLHSGEVVGYSIDVCKYVASKLKERLGLANLKITYVPRTIVNRVQLLRDGAMDIECAASTATEQRKQVASFSLSHFFTATRFVALAKNNFSRLEDLRGRSVSVPAGTVNVGQIGAANRRMNLNLSFVVADSSQNAFDMVTAERVAAFPMDDVLLKMFIKRSRAPESYTLSTERLTEPEPYGLMMRKDDTAFENAVNDALKTLYASPQIDEMYRHWFLQIMPETAISLDLPMSDKLQTWFASFR